MPILRARQMAAKNKKAARLNLAAFDADIEKSPIAL